MYASALLATLLTGAFAQDTPAEAPKAPAASSEVKPIVPADGANYVAVVIGMSSYDSLPDPVELDFARSDAAVVTKALKEKANFTHTFLVTDGEATREKVRELLRTEVAQLVGPNDVFLLYFVGHGVGADLDQPALLLHDSTLEDAGGTGLELQEFVTDLGTWTPARTTLIVTDAIHRNQLDGVYFFGPAANQWPPFAGNVAVISSSQADSPAKDGAFGKVFAEAIGGESDTNRDGYVTLAELEAFLEARVAPMGQIPVRAPVKVPAGTVVAAGVASPAPPAAGTTATAAPVELEPVFPDLTVWSAKFVFREGASQSVKCPKEEVKACSPSCYVRDFQAGICRLKAVVDGVELEGKVAVTDSGKYDCGLKAGRLSCKPPFEKVEKPEDYD